MNSTTTSEHPIFLLHGTDTLLFSLCRAMIEKGGKDARENTKFIGVRNGFVLATDGKSAVRFAKDMLSCAAILEDGTYDSFKLKSSGVRGIINVLDAPVFPPIEGVMESFKSDWVFTAQAGEEGTLNRMDLCYEVSKKGVRMDPSRIQGVLTNRQVRVSGSGELQPVLIQVLDGPEVGLEIITMPFKKSTVVSWKD